MAKKPTKKNLFEQELILCHQLLEYYYDILQMKIHKQKLTGKKAKKIINTLCKWEEVIFEKLGAE